MISSLAKYGGRIANVQSQLSKSFDSAFFVWRPSTTGWRLIEDVAAPSAEWPVRHGSKLNVWFDFLKSENIKSPQCRRFNDQIIVAILVETEYGDSQIVAGKVQFDSLQIVERAAEIVLSEADHAADAAVQQVLVEQYADKLIGSYEELTFLRRLSRHVEYCSADRSLASAAKAILPQLCELAGLEALCLVGATPVGTKARPAEILGHSGEIPSMQFMHDLIMTMEASHRRVVVNNYLSELADKSLKPSKGIRSIVVVPVEKEGNLFGWLVGCNKRLGDNIAAVQQSQTLQDEIGSIEASTLEAAALMLGSHAANNLLFREKEMLVVEVIHTLVGVIEAKDVYTCGHSDRVALIASRLGSELGLSNQECQDIFLSGLLHDIGKIGVADDILLKPDRLTAEEFLQIKQHPERGARLLRGLKPLEKLIPGILHHHEAIDGTGYPNGLKGDSIPLMAKILAVADAFDAMTSTRPYRMGMPLPKAEEILRNGSGTQWDSKVVDAYFTARSEIVEIGLQWQRHLNRLLNWRPECSEIERSTNLTWLSFQHLNPAQATL